jgi:hypothetical protein
MNKNNLHGSTRVASSTSENNKAASNARTTLSSGSISRSKAPITCKFFNN